jgi:RNA-binding protein 8A
MCRQKVFISQFSNLAAPRIKKRPQLSNPHTMADEGKNMSDGEGGEDNDNQDQGLTDNGRRKKGRGHRQGSGTILAGEGESLVGGLHRSRGPAPSVEGWILFISGVHEDAVEDDIQEAFEDYGDIKDIQLPIDRRTGYVKGYSLIQYSTQHEAREALTEMDGAEVLGEKVRVSWAVITPDTGGGNRGRNNNNHNNNNNNNNNGGNRNRGGNNNNNNNNNNYNNNYNNNNNNNNRGRNNNNNGGGGGGGRRRSKSRDR